MCNAVLSCFVAVLLSQSVCCGETIVHRFGPGSFGDPAWERRYNAESESFRLEPGGGWVIDFEPGTETSASPLKSAGFRSVFVVEGDFRVTMDFTLTRIDVPKDRGNTEPGIFLRVMFGGDQHVASIGLVRSGDASWLVKGQVAASPGNRIPFREKIPRPLSQLIIARVGETLSLSGRRGNAEPTVFLECDVYELLEKPGQVNLWVTSGKTPVPMQLAVQSVVVESDQVELGQRAAVEDSFPWRTTTIVFAIAAAIGALLTVHRRAR